MDKSSMQWLAAAFILFLTCSCAPEKDSLPEDPKLWTHEQLMEGAQLLRPADSNGIIVLFVKGLPYQMGYQQGHLLAEELAFLRESIETNIMWYTVLYYATNYGPDGGKEAKRKYLHYTRDSSYESILEECRGLVAASGEVFSVEECTGLNSTTWIFEDLLPRYLPYFDYASFGCSGFMAAGPATRDERLIHARNFDWLPVEGIMQYPLVMVREPEGKLRHVTMGGPAFLAAFTGMNEAGITVATNETTCREEHRDLEGRETLQLATRILEEARTLEEAQALVESTEHATCEIMFISHGPSRTACIVEKTASTVVFRELDESGLVFGTNHFLHESTVPQWQLEDTSDLSMSTVSRVARLTERLTGGSIAPHPALPADAPDYAYGKLDVQAAIDIMRDPVDMRADQGRLCFPCTTYDGMWSVGNASNMQSVVMAPEEGRFWLAAGWDQECTNPAYNPYIGFDLDDLFSGTYTPLLVPTYDPAYNDTFCAGQHSEDE